MSDLMIGRVMGVGSSPLGMEPAVRALTKLGVELKILEEDVMQPLEGLPRFKLNTGDPRIDTYLRLVECGGTPYLILGPLEEKIDLIEVNDYLTKMADVSLTEARPYHPGEQNAN